MRPYKFLIALLTFHLQVAGQTNIQLVLTTDKQIDKVDAFDLSQKEIYSFSYKDTLSFQFKKNSIDCYNIRYHEKGKMYRQQIWLDTGDIVIKSHLAGDDLIIDTVINSPIYYKATDFYKSYSDILKTNDTIEINNFLLNAYEENLNNPFSYAIGQVFLLRNQNSKLNLINFKSLIDRQGNKFNWFLLYPFVVDRINNILSIDNVKITDFTFINSQNQKSKLNLTGADYYIIDFWFLACAPCIRDHKDVKPTLKKLKNKNIQIIGISVDQTDKYNDWRTYLIKNNYSWQNYMQDSKSSLTEHLAIGTYPTYVILNKEGEIIGSYNLFSDISKKFGLDE
ncbi:MAG: TlpA family protein disulfide reductase [Chitinophagaceae bacterium]|jgi:hypothetical protein|nr:TlpA family protein disulfide reductase [Chitinophagaceae bacterium]